MRIGIDVSQHQLTWDELLARVRFAEEAGFDGAWVFDHFKPLYADPQGPCLEGWTLLAGLSRGGHDVTAVSKTGAAVKRWMRTLFELTARGLGSPSSVTGTVG